MSSGFLFRLVQGALAGALGAAAVDLAAARKWKSFDEAQAYDWRLAAFRVGYGAITGMCSVVGLGGISGIVTG